jgi:lipoyl(octanoyl) transferase
VIIRQLGLVEYVPTFDQMKSFTDARDPETPDELWMCQHPAVYTQGLAGRAEHVLMASDIPVIQTNRGGQITYHGPGQVVAYPLLDLRRRGYFVKELVYRIEEAVIRTLRHFGVTGHRVKQAPGIYVNWNDPFGHGALKTSSNGQVGDQTEPHFHGLGKIAALGIKVSRHCCYHGVALNVAMDLKPFERINPCGYAGLKTVDLASLGVQADCSDVAQTLSAHLQGALG